MKTTSDRIDDALRKAKSFGPVSKERELQIAAKITEKIEKQQKYREVAKQRRLGTIQRELSVEKSLEGFEKEDIPVEIYIPPTPPAQPERHQLVVHLEFIAESVLVSCKASGKTHTFLLPAANVLRRS